MAKKLLTINAEVITKNERKGGGNVMLAVDSQETADNKTTARKAINYQTTDQNELDAFKIGAKISITFEQ
jgi:hypothetical protein